MPPPPGLGGALGAPAKVDPRIASWKVDEVVAYAVSLELGHMEILIRKEGIDGEMLLQSTAEDLMSAGFTFFQARKCLSRLPLTF